LVRSDKRKSQRFKITSYLLFRSIISLVGLACRNSKIKNQSSNCTINNNKSKRKKKNVPDDGEGMELI
jgi:hypothetical protein